jgi:hypothetical protein
LSLAFAVIFRSIRINKLKLKGKLKKKQRKRSRFQHKNPWLLVKVSRRSARMQPIKVRRVMG